MSAFSVENPHDGKIFENYTRFEWGVEVGVVTIFMLRLFVPHEFDTNIFLKDSAKPLSSFIYILVAMTKKLFVCLLLLLFPSKQLVQKHASERSYLVFSCQRAKEVDNKACWTTPRVAMKTSFWCNFHMTSINVF